MLRELPAQATALRSHSRTVAVPGSMRTLGCESQTPIRAGGGAPAGTTAGYGRGAPISRCYVTHCPDPSTVVLASPSLAWSQSAVLIAEPIQRATRIKLHRRGVQRIRHTPIQPGLGYRERALNINDAFRVRKPWHGETVALIDDVMTTGATASALTAALLQAGVAEVHVWCATRAAAS